MSRQTEAAAAAASKARAAWREHVASCVQCAQQRHKRPAVRVLCGPGAGMRRAVVDAERALDLAREDDRKPLPGQAELPLNLPGQLELYGDVLP